MRFGIWLSPFLIVSVTTSVCAMEKYVEEKEKLRFKESHRVNLEETFKSFLMRIEEKIKIMEELCQDSVLPKKEIEKQLASMKNDIQESKLRIFETEKVTEKVAKIGKPLPTKESLKDEDPADLIKKGLRILKSDKIDKLTRAEVFFRGALSASELILKHQAQYELARVYKKQNRFEKALSYARGVVDRATALSLKREALVLLVKIYIKSKNEAYSATAKIYIDELIALEGEPVSGQMGLYLRARTLAEGFGLDNDEAAACKILRVIHKEPASKELGLKAVKRLQQYGDGLALPESAHSSDSEESSSKALENHKNE